MAFAPIISASDAWVVFRQAHFYKDQRRTPPAHLRTEGVDCQQGIPRLEAGAVPIQGPGAPQSASGQGSAPLECGGLPLLLLLLRETGAAPSPPPHLRLAQALCPLVSWPDSISRPPAQIPCAPARVVAGARPDARPFPREEPVRPKSAWGMGRSRPRSGSSSRVHRLCGVSCAGGRALGVGQPP